MKRNCCMTAMQMVGPRGQRNAKDIGAWMAENKVYCQDPQSPHLSRRFGLIGILEKRIGLVLVRITSPEIVE